MSSRRQSVPLNMFLRAADPMPPLFDPPNEGDFYYNTTFNVVRIYKRDRYSDPATYSWQDLTTGGSAELGKDTTWTYVGPNDPGDPTLVGNPDGLNAPIWIDTDAGVDEGGGTGGGGGGGHQIMDEGAALPARPALNFVGAGVTASDTAGVTKVSVPMQTIVQPEPPIPTGLPDGTWWVDEDSEVEAGGGGGGGTTILDGVLPPEDSLGVIGDYYLDRSENILYGPKADQVTDLRGALDTVTDPFVSDFSGSYRIATEFEIERNAEIVGLRFYRHASSGLTSRVLDLWVDEDFIVSSLPTAEPAGEGWVTAMLPYPVHVETYTYVMCATTETVVTPSWESDKYIPAPRFVWEEGWSSTSPIGTTDYPSDTYPDCTFPLDFIIEEVLEPVWTPNVISERTRGVWLYAAEYDYDDPTLPTTVPDGQMISVRLEPDAITGISLYHYRFSGRDVDGYDRTSYLEASSQGDTVVFHRRVGRTDDYVAATAAMLSVYVPDDDSAFSFGVEKPSSLDLGYEYAMYPVSRVDEANEGMDLRFFWRGSNSSFYSDSIGVYHMSIDTDIASVTEPGTPALLWMGENSLHGLSVKHWINGISEGDSILLSGHSTDLLLSAESYKARVASAAFFTWTGGYGIPLLLDPPVTAKVPPTIGTVVQMRLSVDAAYASQGAGFMGSWSSSRDYPPGAFVTYGGFLWGTEKGAPKGSAPTSVPVTPGGVLTLPTPANNIASAPLLSIPPGTASAVTSYYYGGPYDSEAGEPNGVQTITHSGRTMWWKYLPTLNGTIGVYPKAQNSFYPCSIDVFRLRAPTYTGFSDLTLVGGSTVSSFSAGSVTVVAGATYYVRLCARVVDYLNYRMTLTNPVPTTPMDYWTKVGTVPA